jgi:hypothetical protein
MERKYRRLFANINLLFAKFKHCGLPKIMQCSPKTIFYAGGMVQLTAALF